MNNCIKTLTETQMGTKHPTVVFVYILGEDEAYFVSDPTFGDPLPYEPSFELLAMLENFYLCDDVYSVIEQAHKQAYQNWVDINNGYKGGTEPGRGPSRPHTQKIRKQHPGYVYVVQSGDAFKIGLSKNVPQRVEQIQPIMPYPVEIILTIQTENMRTLEARLHKRYASKRLNGEWFALTDQDIEDIKREYSNE